MEAAQLEIKKYRLEILKAFLAVASPLIVLGFGFSINSKLEAQKEILHQAELRQQKIDLMQKIVPQLFDSNDSKTVAMMLLLKSIDSSMAESIQVILISNYNTSKQENDTIHSNSLLNAAESYGGKLADTLKKMNGKFETATQLENLGYEALANKDVDKAIMYFDNANKAYPKFRQSYEIKNYLDENKKDLKDSNSSIWKEALKTIAVDYNAQIPKNLKKQFLK